jgi:hypothetical protein
MAGDYPLRPWREIARELAWETDPKRIDELTEELDRAITEQELQASVDDPLYHLIP